MWYVRQEEEVGEKGRCERGKEKERENKERVGGEYGGIDRERV